MRDLGPDLERLRSELTQLRAQLEYARQAMLRTERLVDRVDATRAQARKARRF